MRLKSIITFLATAIIATLPVTGCDGRKECTQVTAAAQAAPSAQQKELLIKYIDPYVGVAPKVSKVYINGSLITTFTECTPVKLPLKPGAYEIEVKADGYTSLKEKVQITADLPQQLIYAPQFTGAANAERGT